MVARGMLVQVGLRAHAGTWPQLAASPAPTTAAAPIARASRRALLQLPAQPRRPPPSPAMGRSLAAAATACGRVGEGPLPPPHPTGRENKAAAAAALTFSVPVPRSLRRLLTEAGSTGHEELGARQRLDLGRGANEASRASQDPASCWRPFLPPSSLLPPPRPVLRPEGGGPGRAGRGRARGGGAGPARGLPGAVVSPRERPVVTARGQYLRSLYRAGAIGVLVALGLVPHPPRSWCLHERRGAGHDRVFKPAIHGT